MQSKILISFFYAFAFTLWPPDNGKTQVKTPDTVLVDEFDSAVFYELVEERARFKTVAGTTKAFQKEALRNLSILESRKKPKRIDTVYVPYYIPVYDSVPVDTPKHKRSFFNRIFH